MKKTIWNALLNAELNVTYWKKLVQCYQKRDLFFKIFLAVVTSGTVASWGIWNEFPVIWKILSSFSAVVAIALPILNYHRLVESMSNLAGEWCELKAEYHDQWLKIKNNKNIELISNQYKETKLKEGMLVKKEIKLPHKEKLINLCYEEVKKTYGLH